MRKGSARAVLCRTVNQDGARAGLAKGSAFLLALICASLETLFLSTLYT